jgi:sodium-dependent dicarboxylate transporter 2/3/5
MWVSNTATSLMMLPIAMSVVQLFPAATRPTRGMHEFGTALLLAVAYGATTGGMGTLIGTPPNALLAAYMSDIYDVTIGFGQWMLLSRARSSRPSRNGSRARRVCATGVVSTWTGSASSARM